MRSNIIELVNNHSLYRRRCLNLVPSENVLSKSAMRALICDLAQRYHHEDFYGGTKYANQIIELTRDLLSELYRAEFVFVEPLSGNIAFLSALLSLTKPKDKVAIIHPEEGGYPFNFNPINRIPVYLLMDFENGTVDIEKSKEIIQKEKPKLIVLGASFIMFPHPVKELSEIGEDVGALTVYDGSHVLGLIAGNKFQDPLREGAVALLGSTHKTFPGPQGGIILTNDDDVAKKLSEVITFPPVLVDNIHLNRVAALGITAEEMLRYGAEYATKIVENAQFLAKALHSNGLNVMYKEKGFTMSHQIWYKVRSENEGYRIKTLLERARIIVDAGVRFGTQEVTRLGISEEDLKRIAEVVYRILVLHEEPSKLTGIIREISNKLNIVHFSFDIVYE